MTYKIAIADDHHIFRAGLRSLIEKDPSFKVMVEASDGEQLLDKLKTHKCDLALLDISMPNLDGLSTLREIKKRSPKLKVLVLTMQKDQEHFKRAMENGASGYMLKDDAYEQLILGIKIILKDKKFISPAIAGIMTDNYVRSLDAAETSSVDVLTKRELQILKMIASGMANKNIATRLKLSTRTVETHRANLSRKLGARNTASLVKYALSKGLI
jgi:DNA-binding NarL/FixJ family response regulator